MKFPRTGRRENNGVPGEKAIVRCFQTMRQLFRRISKVKVPVALLERGTNKYRGRLDLYVLSAIVLSKLCQTRRRYEKLAPVVCTEAYFK